MRVKSPGTRLRDTALLLLMTAASLSPLHAADPDERLRYRLEAPAAEALIVGADERLHAVPTLRRFYAQRLYAPAWTEGGMLTAAAEQLLRAIRSSEADGLHPRDYHLEAIESLLTRSPSDQAAMDLELLLTDAYLLLGSHLVGGRVDPVRFDSEWHAQRREADLVIQLETALHEGSIDASLATLRPAQPGYQRLQEALARHRTLVRMGGWPAISSGPALKPDMRDARVPLLRARLAASGDLASGADTGEVYDSALQQAVERFQHRNGLDADGVVGRATLAALNVSAADRVRQIEINLERWRWLPQELGPRHIRVNIADFTLELWEDGQPRAKQKVVVGRDYRRTPVFSGNMSYIVLNPYWEVPPQIAVKDILPQLRKDPEYLARMNMQLLRGWGADEKVVDPATVNWQTLLERGFPYRFRQAPGANNALGRAKFMFPNSFSIYLHDSPARGLFSERRRAFSSGCIRVHDPEALAVWVLNQSKWSRAEIDAAIASGVSRTVSLAKPVPVHLQYWTAWVDTDGAVHFREDIYDRDGRVAVALEQAAPKPEKV